MFNFKGCGWVVVVVVVVLGRRVIDLSVVARLDFTGKVDTDVQPMRPGRLLSFDSYIHGQIYPEGEDGDDNFHGICQHGACGGAVSAAFLGWLILGRLINPWCRHKHGNQSSMSLTA